MRFFLKNSSDRILFNNFHDISFSPFDWPFKTGFPQISTMYLHVLGDKVTHWGVLPLHLALKFVNTAVSAEHKFKCQQI